MLELYPKQEKIVERTATEPTKAALQISDLGAGKTLMAVELAKRINANTVLVIAPIGTHKQWVKQFTEQGYPHPVKLIESKHPENQSALTAGVPGAYIVGREYYYLSATASPPTEKLDGSFTRGRKAKWVWTKTNPDLTVVDECHNMKNRYGLLYETLKNMPSKFRLAMSATPQGSSFDGIWTVTRWLWPKIVDRSKVRWTAEWCTTEEVVTGRRIVVNPDTGEREVVLDVAVKVMGEKEPGKYLNSLPCVVKMELPKKPYELIDVNCSLTPEQRMAWDEMAETSIAWLKDNPTVAKIPIEQRIRLRQMALAMPQVCPETHEVSFADDADSRKIEAAKKIQARHPGEAILFVTDSRKFALVAAPRLGAKLLVGGMKKSDKDRLVDTLGTDYQYLVCTYGAVAEGTDGLQKHCHIEVLFNPADGSVPNQQFAGRLNRIGQEADTVIRYRLIARNTLDDDHWVTSVLNVQARQKETVVYNEW